MAIHLKTFCCFLPLLLALAMILASCAGVEPGDGRVTVNSNGNSAVALNERFQ